MAEPRYETIRPRTRRLGRRVIHLASTTSTMDEMRRLVAQGADSGTVLVADVQTAGRGRAERGWHSPPGGLHATILVRDEVPLQALPLLSLATGVAAARAIERLLGLRTQLKWPNDVWINGKKVGGILLETRLDGSRVEHVLIGIGINGNLRPHELPETVRNTATSLSSEAQRHVCLPALLKILLERLDATVQELSLGQTSRVLDEIRGRSLVLGRRVRVETEAGPAEGVAKSIGEQGELVVETAQGSRVINVGDCQLLRPLDG